MSSKSKKNAVVPHVLKAKANGNGANTSDEALAAHASNLTTGKRARRAIMLKQFIPHADWINRNVVAKGKGTHVLVGRIVGTASGAVRKTNTLPDGKQIASVVINGVFETESYLTGEIAEATSVYLPLAYAEKIATLFESDPTIKIVEVDIDVGLEATGKTIPYEWTVTAFREGAEMDVLKRIKAQRGRPKLAVKLDPTLAIEHKAE